MAFNFGKKKVFPAQREDEDGTVQVSRESWDQMQQMLGGLAESVKKLERQRARPAAVAQPQQPQVPIKPHKPEIDFSDLPDPLQDKAGFLAGAAKKLQTQLDTMAATMQAGEGDKAKAAQQAAVLQNRVNGLWKKWQKSYGKRFGKADKLVEVEAARMVQEGIASGMSLDDVMFADEDGFLEDLAERVGGSLEELGVQAQPERDAGAAAREVDEGLQKFGNMFEIKDMPDGRDADLAAGDMGSLTPRRKKSEADKPIPLTEQLSKAQEEMGLI